MKQKSVVYLAVFLFFAISAAAEPLVLLDPLQGIDFGSFYQDNYAFIDGIIYLLIFIGLARFAFGRIYGKGSQSSKAVTIGVGLALAFAASFFELQTGFNLGVLGPYAALIILLIMLFLLFELFKSVSEDSTLSAAIAILLGYGLLRTALSPLWNWIEQTPTLKGIVHLAALTAVIVIIIKLFGMFGSKGKDNGGAGKDGKDGDPGKDGRPGKDGKEGKDGRPGKDGTGGGGGDPHESLRVFIENPKNGSSLKHSDNFHPKVTIRGGSPPYNLELFLDEKPLDHDPKNKGNYEKNFGKPQKPLFTPEKEHVLIANVVDSNGQKDQTAVKFHLESEKLTVEIIAPRKIPMRNFNENEEIAVRLKIKGGQRPYTVLLYLNGKEPRNFQDFLTDSYAGGRTEKGEIMQKLVIDEKGECVVGVEKDSKGYSKRNIGGENTLIVLLVDSKGERAMDAIKFTIGKRTHSEIGIKIIKPEEKGVKPNESFNISWVVDKGKDYNEKSSFIADIMVRKDPLKASDNDITMQGIKYQGLEHSVNWKGMPEGKWIVWVMLKDEGGMAGHAEKIFYIENYEEDSELKVNITSPHKTHYHVKEMPIKFEWRVSGEGYHQSSKFNCTAKYPNEKGTQKVESFTQYGLSNEILKGFILPVGKHSFEILIYDPATGKRASDKKEITVTGSDGGIDVVIKEPSKEEYSVSEMPKKFKWYVSGEGYHSSTIFKGIAKYPGEKNGIRFDQFGLENEVAFRGNLKIGVNLFEVVIMDPATGKTGRAAKEVEVVSELDEKNFQNITISVNTNNTIYVNRPFDVILRRVPGVFEALKNYVLWAEINGSQVKIRVDMEKSSIESRNKTIYLFSVLDGKYLEGVDEVYVYYSAFHKQGSEIGTKRVKVKVVHEHGKPGAQTPEEKNWAKKIEEELKKISGKKLKDLKLSSRGSFAAEFVKSPSNLGLTQRLKNSEEAIKKILSLVNVFENKVHSGYVEVLNKQYLNFSQCFTNLNNNNYRDVLIELCKKLGINPTNGNSIGNAINRKSIDEEKNPEKKTIRRDLERMVRFLYANYVLMYRALYYFRETASKIVKEK